MSMKWRHALVLVVMLAGGACARTQQRGPARVPDTAPERVAASQQASRVGEPEAAEERFAPERARALRDEEKARADEQRKRVDVVDTKKKAPPPPQAPSHGAAPQSR
jgi:hypothetical protein